MKNEFIDFWRLYAPQKEFKNRYQACEKVWGQMDEQKRRLILSELMKERTENSSLLVHKKNPYFFLVDWQPPQPHWLTPAEVGHLLAQKVALAVCRNTATNRFGTVTRAEAESYGLEVHHYM